MIVIEPGHDEHATADRARQVLMWAVTVLILAALIVLVIEVVRSDPASAPTGSGRRADLTLASSSSHLYGHTDDW